MRNESKLIKCCNRTSSLKFFYFLAGGGVGMGVLEYRYAGPGHSTSQNKIIKFSTEMGCAVCGSSFEHIPSIHRKPFRQALPSHLVSSSLCKFLGKMSFLSINHCGNI